MGAPVKDWEPAHNPEAVDEGRCGWPSDGWHRDHEWGDDAHVADLDPDIGDDH
jgi:hypothetical protein